jgi:hypothetical protein
MNKLILVIILLCAIYFSNRMNKQQKNTFQENFDNYKQNITNYNEIVSNYINMTNYKHLNLYGKHNINDKNVSPNLCDIDSILHTLKKKSKFISINNLKNKSIIGLFLNTTDSLSKLLDECKYTQQDFMDERLSNGLLLFFLMVNTKYFDKKKTNMIKNNNNDRNNINIHFKTLFKKLLSDIISMYKSKKSIDSRQVTRGNFSYVLYPVEKNYMNSPVVEVLVETGFRRVVYKFQNVTFYKLYL